MTLLTQSGCKRERIHRANYVAPCFQSFASNVGRANKIRIGLEATFNTKERALATTVLFGAITTSNARPRCVARVNDYHRDARRFALVGHKRPQLCEGPRKPFVALSPSHRNPLTDALKVFQRDCPLLNECFVDEMTTDVMIDPPLIAGLFLPDALQVPFGRLGTAGLKPLTEPLEAAATLPDARARVHIAVAVYSELDDTQVNAQNVLNVSGGAEGKSTVTYR